MKNIDSTPETIINIKQTEEFIVNKASTNEVIQTFLPEVTVHTSNEFVDDRGGLTFFEFNKHVPFYPKRSFMIYDVPADKFRGNHAHRMDHQFLICLKGSVTLFTDNGLKRQKIILDSAKIGIYVKPKVWNILYNFSKDAVVTVFTLHHFDVTDYIHSYPEFLQLNDLIT